MPQDHSNTRHSLATRRLADGHSVPARHLRNSGSPPRDAGENILCPSFIVWVLRQWWLVIIPIGLALAVMAGGIVMYFYVPKFEATALLMIEDVGQFVAF